MKLIKYFLEFFFIIILFIIFKIIGYKNSSNLGEIFGKSVGPIFRSKQKIQSNLQNARIVKTEKDINNLISSMWGNYGRILSEYLYLKSFRDNSLSKFISISGSEILDEIKKNNEQVVFISGHFNNFELMAMEIDKFGIKCAAIYRPLNNIFLNPLMEYLRMKYICPNQIPKGRMGMREIIQKVKNGYSVALMVDQRVSEAPREVFFNKPAHTTTIPAQLALKYNCKLVPISLERKEGVKFLMTVHEPYKINKTSDNKLDTKNITLKINQTLEQMVIKNPTQWIWSHNRWK